MYLSGGDRSAQVSKQGVVVHCGIEPDGHRLRATLGDVAYSDIYWHIVIFMRFKLREPPTLSGSSAKGWTSPTYDIILISI